MTTTTAYQVQVSGEWAETSSDEWRMSAASEEDCTFASEEAAVDHLKNVIEAVRASNGKWALEDDDAPRFRIAEVPLHWALLEGGHAYDTIEADDAEEALETAKGNVDRANYADETGTIYINVCVRCLATGEEASAIVQLDPPAPECEGHRSHHWEAPYAIVGGLPENPGVWGHAGGVIMHEVCTRCGCGRTTDTWAQNPSTGEQGLTTVTYEPGEGQRRSKEG
jgi:hypothetical protein